MNEFVAHVGDPRLHDSTIASVERTGDRLTVVAEDPDGAVIEVTFTDVTAVDDHEAVAIMVYSLAEWRQPNGQRRFVFGNWEEPEDSDARLSVVASNFSCRELP